MAYAEFRGIGAKGQAKFRLCYLKPANPDGSRDVVREPFDINSLPEKASATIKAAKNRKAGLATKTDDYY